MTVRGALVALALIGAAVLAGASPAFSRNKSYRQVEIAVTDAVLGSTTAVVLLPLSANPAARLGAEYWLRAECFQDGQMVYQETLPTVGGIGVLTLDHAEELAGSAECVAETIVLVRGEWVVTGAAEFTVVG